MSESQNLLQRFFDASLIPSETTDERLSHYESAAKDLAKHYAENPHDAVSASRVAIDPNCPETDPWFNTVESAVKVHWKTFLVNNHDKPRQICRAILIEALSSISGQNKPIAYAIWNASSSLLPHLGEGPEQAITREFIFGLGNECEEYSSREWCIETTSTEKLPKFEIKPPTIKVIRVDKAALTNGFSDAAGPQNQQGKNFGDPNPHWPNSPPAWAYEFSPRAASAVATAVDDALKATTPEIKNLSDQLAPALKKHTNAICKWVLKKEKQSERFTTLLWWKQSLYSPCLLCSYRDLSQGEVAITLSFDLGSVSGSSVPTSVEYFLRETIRDVFPENPKLTLSELVEATKSSDKIALCLPEVSIESTSRVSIREFLSLVRETEPAENDFTSYIGISPSTSLPISEWAVWLFRERLAEILTTLDA